MVYKTTISPVGLKFATPAGGSTGEILVSNTLVNQWEELTFDFTAVINAPTSTGIDQIIVFPDFTQRSDNNVCYIDNIKFSNQDGSQNLAPMVAAPATALTPVTPTCELMAAAMAMALPALLLPAAMVLLLGSTAATDAGTA